MKKTILKDRLLTNEQVETVKMCIVSSMKDVYTDKGEIPGEGFYKAAKAVADKVLKDAQTLLIEVNVYAKAVKNSKPLKIVKKKK